MLIPLKKSHEKAKDPNLRRSNSVASSRGENSTRKPIQLIEAQNRELAKRKLAGSSKNAISEKSNSLLKTIPREKSSSSSSEYSSIHKKRSSSQQRSSTNKRRRSKEGDSFARLGKLQQEGKMIPLSYMGEPLVLPKHKPWSVNRDPKGPRKIVFDDSPTG